MDENHGPNNIEAPPTDELDLGALNEEQIRAFAIGILQLAVSQKRANQELQAEVLVLNREKTMLEMEKNVMHQKLEVAEIELKERGKYDSRTGFYTADAFRDSVSDVIEKQRTAAKAGWRRQEDNPELANYLVFMDLDQFKLYNRAFGNERVDELILFPAAKKIDGAIRDDSHLISSPGGDEFLLFLPQVNQEVCSRIVGRVKEALNGVVLPNEEAMLHPELNRRLGVSIGVTSYPLDAEYLDVYTAAHGAHLISKDTPGGNLIIFTD